MADERKDLPTSSATNFGPRVREEMMRFLGRMGSKLDRAVTLRDLVDSGFAKLRDGYLLTGGGSPISGPGTGIGSAPSLTPPPTPSGFTVTGAISNLIIECDPATYQQGHGHGASVLYGTTVAAGDPLPTFADAVELMAAPGTVFAYATDPSTTWRLWLKWRSRDGVLSVDPAGGINGIEGKTGTNVAKLVQAMTGPGNPFKIVAVEMTLPDGSIVPAGTYTSDAYIHNGFIQNAMIANLAVDNAKVANLSAAKLTAGSIAVGEYIQSTDYVANVSGWRVNGAGNVEFGNGVFRGLVYAAGGTIGGSIIATTFMRSTNYAAGGYGWRLDSGGTGQIGGFTIATDAIFSGNYSAGVSGWRIANDGSTQFGDILLIGGTIRNATDSFHMDMGATGGALLLRAGAWTSYGPYAGSHYPVEVRADGGAFFGRGVVSGGLLKASGTYSIPSAERPSVQFLDTAPPSGGGGDGP